MVIIMDPRKWLIGWKESRQARRRAVEIYRDIVNCARDPFLFEVIKLPDSPQGRFESIVLHMFMVQQRFLKVPSPGKIPQRLMDAMVEDFDNSVREMGVGDLSVGKNVKRLSVTAQQRFIVYQSNVSDALGLQNTLKDVFSFADSADSEACLEVLTKYVRLMMTQLESCPDRCFFEAKFSLPSVSKDQLVNND